MTRHRVSGGVCVVAAIVMAGGCSRDQEATPSGAPVGSEGSRTKVDGLSMPPARGDQVKIEDDGTAAEKIVAFLVERKVVV